MDLPKVHVAGNSLAAPPKRRRFAPIKDGRLALARLEMELEQIEGVTWPVIKEGPKARWISVRLVIAAGQSAGRWFFDRLWVGGTVSSIERTNDAWHMMRSCYTRDRHYGEPSLPQFAELAGRVYPIRVTQVPHWQTGQLVNSFVPLGPDQFADGYDDYIALVKRYGRDVPGWQLWEHSNAATLVRAREAAETTIGAAGLSVAEERRRKGRARRRQLDIEAVLDRPS